MTTSVDVQGMQAAQQDFQLALDQMNSVYSAMTEEQDTLSSNWSGMAASAFGQALGAWLDDLYQIRQELVVMTESLSAHTGIYSDANEASQQVVTAFQQGLDGLEGLPGEPMYAARQRVEGKLLPEKGVLAARMAVRGKMLPGEPGYAPGQSEPEIPLQPRMFMRSEEKPAEPLQPAELDLPRYEAIPAQPVMPAMQDEQIPQEPLLPAELDLPRYDAIPAQPVMPALRDEEIPKEPLQSTLRLRDVPAGSDGS